MNDFKVIESKFPVKNLYIEPLGNYWAVYSNGAAPVFERRQEDVFETLEKARDYVLKQRTGQTA